MGMNVGGGPHADINITPLIDVLLVLIIIFMIIQTRSQGLQAVVPQPAPPQSKEPPARTIVVQLSEDGSLHINQESVALDRLGPRLLEIFAARAEKICFVRADPGIEFQRVAEIIDIAKGAGVDSVGLMNAEPAGNISRR